LGELLAHLAEEQSQEGQRRHKKFLAWWDRFPKIEFFASLSQEIEARESPSHAPGEKGLISGMSGTLAFASPSRSSNLVEGTAGGNSQPHRIAAIDVGTNSIRLTVAEVSGDGRYRILDDEKETTRLGRGLQTSGMIDVEAMARSAQAIARMKK